MNRSLTLLLLAALAGCSRSAQIERTDGTTVEGRILGGDHATLEVETDDGIVRVDRAVITDIDHPGNVWLTLALIPTAIGTAFVIGGLTASGGDGLIGDTGAFFMLFGAPYLVLGLPPLIWGASTWGSSRSRSSRPAATPSVSLGVGGISGTF